MTTYDELEAEYKAAKRKLDHLNEQIDSLEKHISDVEALMMDANEAEYEAKWGK